MTLSKPCPPLSSLETLIRESVARFAALPPERQKEIRNAQRKSWVIGEMLLEHPEMTREEAERVWDKVERGI